MRTGITALTLFICITAKLCSAQAAADTTLLRKHLLAQVSGKEYRTYTNTEKLNQTADYILSVLAKYTDSVGFQKYSVDGKTYKKLSPPLVPTRPNALLLVLITMCAVRSKGLTTMPAGWQDCLKWQGF